MKFIKTGKLGHNYKMHFPKDVADKLGVDPGGYIHFYEAENGDIVIKKA